MGRVREYAFDSVIGVGGIGREAKSCEIDRKLTWVGIGTQRAPNNIVTFEHFVIFDERGPLLEDLAPHLARRMYGSNVRVLLDKYSDRERTDAERILRWSRTRKAQRLNGKSSQQRKSGCRRRCRPIREVNRC